MSVSYFAPRQSAQGAGFTAQLGVRMPFAAGEEIYAQDEDADMIYQLVSGVARTTRLFADGRRQIGDFYFAGDLIGIETEDQHCFSAEALSDCEVLVIKRSALERVGAEGERVQQLVWSETARELARAKRHLALLGRKTAREKVASFLLDIATRVGEDVTPLTMGRQDMADYLGLTIETVSRMVTQLQSDGLISLEGCRRFRIRSREELEYAAAA
ncbi:MAG: helix-turn-helix domain-containing protein [Caulobacteraceae bacterium]